MDCRGGTNGGYIVLFIIISWVSSSLSGGFRGSCCLTDSGRLDMIFRRTSLPRTPCRSKRAACPRCAFVIVSDVLLGLLTPFVTISSCSMMFFVQTVAVVLSPVPESLGWTGILNFVR